MAFAAPSITLFPPVGWASSEADLFWQASDGSGPYAGTYTSYQIWRKTGAGSFVQVGTKTSGDTGSGEFVFWADTTAVASTQYTYEIRGIYSLGTSSPVISNDVGPFTTPASGSMLVVASASNASFPWAGLWETAGVGSSETFNPNFAYTAFDPGDLSNSASLTLGVGDNATLNSGSGVVYGGFVGGGLAGGCFVDAVGYYTQGVTPYFVLAFTNGTPIGSFSTVTVQLGSGTVYTFNRSSATVGSPPGAPVSYSQVLRWQIGGGTSYPGGSSLFDSTGATVTTLTFTGTWASNSLSIAPTSATVPIGGQQLFTATVVPSGTPLAWSCLYGTVSGTGLYTAPPLPGHVSDTVTVVDTAGLGLSASAAVTLTVPTLTAYGKFVGSGSFAPVVVANAGTINPKIYEPVPGITIRGEGRK